MFPNAINPVDTGLIPVAILTTDTFDATPSGSRSRPLGDDWLGIWSIEESVVFRCTNWYIRSCRMAPNYSPIFSITLRILADEFGA